MPCTQKRWFICSANIYQVPDLGQAPVQAGDAELGGIRGFLPRSHPGSNGFLHNSNQQLDAHSPSETGHESLTSETETLVRDRNFPKSRSAF